MGGQTRYARRTPPAWAATVGAMLDSGTEVYATCTACQWEQRPYPLEPVIEKLGRDYSLFDRRPKCRQPGCERGLVLFMYRPGGTHGSPFRPCKTTL